MNTTNNNAFKWDKLIRRIKNREVIPVIGEGLYTIQTPDGKEHPLYHYLAEELAQAVHFPLTPDMNHPFAKATFAFLQAYEQDEPFDKLQDFLLPRLQQLTLVPSQGLQKLAAISQFNWFINTTYDDFLGTVLNATRLQPAQVCHYALRHKIALQQLNTHLTAATPTSAPLILNLYGNLRHLPGDSAYTEAAILETILAFQDHLTHNQQQGQALYGELSRKALLFIGCGYDDWLFRFFIRAISTHPYERGTTIPTKFFGHPFDLVKSHPQTELNNFLSHFGAEIYYTGCAQEFVHHLFTRLEQETPADIIKAEQYPAVAFFSFPGEDRPAVLRIAEALKADGIHVWVDQKEFQPGDLIDDKIIQDMVKCPVFIPILSATSKVLGTNNKWRYHYQEWKWLELYNRMDGTIPKVIIPVSLDGTGWQDAAFHEFSELFKQRHYITIPAGVGGDYPRLRDKLRSLQWLRHGGFSG